MKRRPSLKNILGILGPAANGDCCIIVEGKNDVKALLKAGIPHSRVFQTAQTGYDKLEVTISDFGTYVPLFDFDRTGKRRLNSFMCYFSGTQHKIDVSYSEKLKSTGIKYIEEINNL